MHFLFIALFLIQFIGLVFLGWWCRELHGMLRDLIGAGEDQSEVNKNLINTIKVILQMLKK